MQKQMKHKHATMNTKTHQQHPFCFFYRTTNHTTNKIAHAPNTTQNQHKHNDTKTNTKHNTDNA